jgi:3-hydroxybutyryl-CoA dehydrogenase
MRLGIIGAGQMGIGIAYVGALRAKVPVTILDAKAESLKRGQKFMNVLLQKDVLKGKITQDEADEALNNIKLTTKLADFKDSNFLIEVFSFTNSRL